MRQARAVGSVTTYLTSLFTLTCDIATVTPGQYRTAQYKRSTSLHRPQQNRKYILKSQRPTRNPLTRHPLNHYQATIISAMASLLAPLPLSVTAAAAASAKTNDSSKSDGSAYLSVSDHWTRYAQLRGVEDTKNNFIQDILTRYDSVLRQCQGLINQQDARRDSTSDYTARELLICQQNVAHMQRLLDREPFVTVLIDGNGLIFKDAFLCDGEKGGRQAAIALKNEITQWIPDNIISPPAEFRMNIKVYADFRGLAGTLLRNGTINNLLTLGEFARGFNSHFDFVDIGSGDVNNKIVGT